MIGLAVTIQSLIGSRNPLIAVIAGLITTAFLGLIVAAALRFRPREDERDSGEPS